MQAGSWDSVKGAGDAYVAGHGWGRRWNKGVSRWERTGEELEKKGVKGQNMKRRTEETSKGKLEKSSNFLFLAYWPT